MLASQKVLRIVVIGTALLLMFGCADKGTEAPPEEPAELAATPPVEETEAAATTCPEASVEECFCAADASGFCTWTAWGDEGDGCDKPKIEMPAGFALAENQDPQSIEYVVGSAGNGGTCCGLVIQPTEAVTIYRAFTNTPGEDNEYGSWWAFFDPTDDTKPEYRVAEDLCANYDPVLASVATCTIDLEAAADFTFVMGPGQSACCTQGKVQGYVQSETIQLNIWDNATSSSPSSSSNPFNSNCTTKPWPGLVE